MKLRDVELDDADLAAAKQAALNICGDADLTGEGHITVDKRDRTHPVIRLVKTATDGKKYVAGPDTNIVFTEITAENYEAMGKTAADIGKIAIDVYYK